MTIATSTVSMRRIDFIHLEQLVVGHIRLRQQHVHVSRHPSGHRVDGITHFAAVLLQQLPQFLDGVLGLGDGHAVAGDHDHALRALKDIDRRLRRRVALTSPFELATGT